MKFSRIAKLIPRKAIAYNNFAIKISADVSLRFGQARDLRAVQSLIQYPRAASLRLRSFAGRTRHLEECAYTAPTSNPTIFIKQNGRAVRILPFYLVRTMGLPPVTALADEQSPGLFGASHKLLRNFLPISSWIGLNHGKAVYIINAEHCISPKRSFVYHHCERNTTFG